MTRFGGSRGHTQRVPPVKVPILLFWHTQFSKRNRLGSPRPRPTRSTPPYWKSWIRHWLDQCLDNGVELISFVFSFSLKFCSKVSAAGPGLDWQMSTKRVTFVGWPTLHCTTMSGNLVSQMLKTVQTVGTSCLPQVWQIMIALETGSICALQLVGNYLERHKIKWMKYVSF